MNTKASTALVVVVVLWLSAGAVHSRSIREANADNGHDSCMTRWLRLTPGGRSPAEALRIETVFLAFKNNIDEQSAEKTNRVLLEFALGAGDKAQEFLDCLGGRLENCSLNAPCQHDGRCLYSDNTDVPGYHCKCAEGYTGKFCQQTLSPCTPNPCKNCGSCEAVLTQYQCHCPLGFEGETCQKVWLTPGKYRSLSHTVLKIGQDVERLTDVVSTAQTEQFGQLEAFLQALELRMESKLRNEISGIKASITEMRQNTQGINFQVQGLKAAQCVGTGGWMYRGICLRWSLGTRNNVDVIPQGCRPYQPSVGWTRSDFTAICQHFGRASTCTNVDPDARGGHCSNHQAILTYEYFDNPTDVWVSSSSFSWDPSPDYSNDDCELTAGAVGTIVYACL